jgi:diacylglycerol O-acyltransferase
MVDWFDMSLGDVKAIRKSLGCSVNDVVLGMVTGAVREFLISRRADPDALDFRIATPVNVRRSGQERTAGNFVSTWILPLPIGESDPRKQIGTIHASTDERKESHEESAIELLEAVHEWIPMDLQRLSHGTQNLYVSNVPGPQFPLYLLGAELKELYLQAPLIQNLGLTIAVASYNGKVFCGLNADADRLPDVADLAAMIRSSFERLAESAGVQLEASAPLEPTGGGHSAAEPTHENAAE